MLIPLATWGITEFKFCRVWRVLLDPWYLIMYIQVFDEVDYLCQVGNQGCNSSVVC